MKKSSHKRKSNTYAYIRKKKQQRYKHIVNQSHHVKGAGKLSFVKSPGFLMLASLIAIILVMPTLIVVPYIQGDGQETVTGELKQSSQQYNLEDSPFSVAVMRASSEKVQDIPLEKYVAGVVASEMPAEFELEALKAQSLAARTYVVTHMLNQPEDSKAAVTDTIQHQVYKDESELRRLWGADYEWKMNKINKAVAATKGQILTYKKEPISPLFFSTSNGYTENSEDYYKNKYPYLRSVKSPWDKNSPKFLGQKTIPIKEVEEKLGIDISDDKQLSVKVSHTQGKRVDQIKIADKTLSGRYVREKLNLKSSDFTIEKKNDYLIFTTQGYGHGVGMSQYGANGMAKEGKGYKEILKHYYQGVEISKVTETAPTLVSR